MSDMVGNPEDRFSRVAALTITSILMLSRYLVIGLSIMKTCPCNVYPLEPQFYIAKLGNRGVNLFFLFLLKT